MMRFFAKSSTRYFFYTVSPQESLTQKAKSAFLANSVWLVKIQLILKAPLFSSKGAKGGI